ncbi:hypothetical protein FHT87_005150 [Rhizobium sp. BK316]|uniref:hypothetical protein n=1 Tax=Rhizobium sp. BK316 TaxID=2587053 RepID=UPI00161D5EDC|nr:hypothetical protein [Rhizobium sp. BK316]MBB3411197.1 hypothetical protein [Rhizobium sp. BK316]
MDTLTFSNPVTGENTFHALGRTLGLIDGEEPKPEPYIPTTGDDIRRLSHVDQLPEPKNPQERVARMTGEGAVTMAVPGGLFGKAGTAANIARGAVVGGLSGAGSQTAAEVVPEKYKPLASLVGGLVGGLTGEAVTAVPGVVKSAARGARDYVAPLTEGGRERLAGQALRDAASNPEDVIASIDKQPRNLVAGSEPTTFQLTGDPGLGTLERAVAAKNPETFQQIRGEQNAARLDALSDIQAAGHPEAVSSFFRSQLDDLDKSTQALHEAAETQAKNAASGLGGGDAATLGEQARTAIQNRLDDVRNQERSLWKAVDPEGNLVTVASPIKQAASRIYRDLGPEGELGLAPIEKNIASVIEGYGQTLPFQRLINLRSAVSQAMRDVRSPLQANQPAYARLTQLRGAIEDAISDSIAQKAAQEQQAVVTGALQPEDAMMARIAAERQKWYDERALEASGTGDGRNAGSGQASFSRPSGTESQARSRPGHDAGGEDLSGQPFLDEEAAGRLKTATAATAERKQTYGAKPVSQILQRPGNTQPYTMPSAGVTSSIWKAGNAGADTVRSTLKAAGNSAESVDAIRNMAAQSLRDKAENGVITPKALDAWKKAHGPALHALEEAAPGTMAKFETAAKAGEHLAQTAADRKAALDSYQKSAAGKLLKVDDPSDVVKTIGAIFNRSDAVAQMKALAKAAAADPDAMAGLRKAIVEHMENRLISNTEAGTSGRNLIKSDQFQTFLGKNFTALRQVFSDEELNTMRAIAQDLKRANRSIASSKLPGGSNTAQDTAAIAAHSMKESLLSKIVTHIVGGGAGFLTTGPVGLAAGVVGSHVLGSMREAGIRNIEDLIRDAMLNPDLAKALLMKAPKRPDTGSALTLAARLRNLSAFSAAQSQKQSGDNRQ